jgi:hypothetical protein
MSVDPPTGDDEAWRDGQERRNQAELLADVATSPLVEDGGRLLTDLNPCSAEGLATLLSPLQHAGGTVWLANPDEARWQQRYDEERATASLRAARSS